jgi:hypothetical protein
LFSDANKTVTDISTIYRTISCIDIKYLTIIPDLVRALIKRNEDRRAGRLKKGDIKQIAIDGKTLRGANPKGKAHIMNCLCNMIILLQIKIGAKGNEISVLPDILDMLENENMLAGNLISLNAMGCQKKLLRRSTLIGHFT